MKTVGIIAEYNPFHNGHKYQIEMAKKLTNSNYCAVVMSGNFTQRGDCAIYDKWLRAKIAVNNGADIVFELPTIYSTQSASYFATGGVLTLDALGIINAISFGTESEDISDLEKCVEILNNPPQEFNTYLDKNLKNGYGFAVSRANALEKLVGISTKTPNDILALEYLLAMKKNNINFEICNIKRVNSSHDAKNSAFYIRNLIKENKDYKNLVSKETYEILKNEKYMKSDDFAKSIIYKIRSSSTSYLKEISDVSEGLENRIKVASYNSLNLDEMIKNSVSKRYTNSKIRRILFSVLLDVKKTDIVKNPTYIRVLAFNDNGRKILNEMKEKAKLPIITKLDKTNIDEILEKDINATDIYNLHKNIYGRMDYTTSPIYINQGENK